MRFVLLLLGLLLGVSAPAFADDAVPTPPAWQPDAPTSGAGMPVGPPAEGRYAPAPARSASEPPQPLGPRIIGAPPNEELRRMVRIGDRRALARWRSMSCDGYAISRGPLEVRDPWLLIQPRMTLPAASPDVLAPGRWLIRGGLEWGNDFGFSQFGAAESPTADRRFFVDGEHMTIDAQVRYGLGRCWDVGVRVPLHWRGGGILDGLIEWMHSKFGAKNNSRDEFYFDMYRVQGRDAAFNYYTWADQGWGFGRVELDAKWEFVKPRRRCDLRMAGIVRVGLPSGTGPFESAGVDTGVQVVAAKQFARRWDVYASLGGTWYSDTNIDGFEYEPLRGYGSFSIEYRVLPYWSVILQTDASSRSIANLVDYPEYQWYALIGLKMDLGSGVRLTAGFTENIADQQSTTDFSFWTSFEVEL